MKKVILSLACLPLMIYAGTFQDASSKLQTTRNNIKTLQTSQEIVTAYKALCDSLQNILGSRYTMKQLFLLALSLDANDTKNEGRISQEDYNDIHNKIESKLNIGGISNQRTFFDEQLDRFNRATSRSVADADNRQLQTNLDTCQASMATEQKAIESLQQQLEECEESLIKDQATMRQLETTLQNQDMIIDGLEKQLATRKTECPDLQALIKESRKNTILRNGICTTISSIDELIPRVTDSTYTECSEMIEQVRKPLRDASQLLPQLDQKIYVTDLNILREENDNLFRNLQDGLSHQTKKQSCTTNLRDLKIKLERELRPC